MSGVRGGLRLTPSKQLWTPADDAILRSAVEKELSASKIATLFDPPKTRSAVAGRALRLNLQLLGHKRKVTVKQVSLGAIAIPGPLSSKAASPRREHHAVQITLVQLSNKTCKWPMGDPAKAGFGFCGRHPREGSPYCEIHAQMAYQPRRGRSGSDKFIPFPVMR